MKKMMGIDLGGSEIRVCLNQGVVLAEPAAVALDRHTGDVRAVCRRAGSLAYRTPGNADIVYPMLENLATQYMALREIFRYCMKKARMPRASLILSVPYGLTRQEERVLTGAAEDAGAREVRLIRKSIAAAIGAGVEVMSPQYTMVLDLGAGSAEISAVGDGGGYTVSVPDAGGNAMKSALAAELRESMQISLGDPQLETLKRNAGTVWLNDASKTAENVRALSLYDGLPQTVTVTPDTVAQGLAAPIDALLSALHAFHDQLPGTARDDISIRGIILCGGGAGLTGLDRLIRDEMKLPVTVADLPSDCTPGGLSRILNNPEHFEDDGLYVCPFDGMASDGETSASDA